MLTAAAFARAHRQHVCFNDDDSCDLRCGRCWFLPAWLAAGVFTGLPDEKALRGVGAMAQATTIYDAHDRPAFTFFKEYRLEVPLSQMSPHLIDAILAVEDQRFFDHGGMDVISVAGAAWGNVRNGWGIAGRQHDHSASGASELSDEEKTLRRKLKEVVVAARLEKEFEQEADSRVVSQQGVFRRRPLRRRGRVARLFRQACRRSSTSPRRRCWRAWSRRRRVYAPTVSVDRALSRRKMTLKAMRAAEHD